MRLTEPYAVVDTFVSGLARVEILRHGNVRFTHYAETTGEDGQVERYVVAKIIMPAAAIAEARRLTNITLSEALSRDKPDMKVAAGAH